MTRLRYDTTAIWIHIQVHILCPACIYIAGQLRNVRPQSLGIISHSCPPCSRAPCQVPHVSPQIAASQVPPLIDLVHSSSGGHGSCDCNQLILTQSLDTGVARLDPT